MLGPYEMRRNASTRTRLDRALTGVSAVLWLGRPEFEPLMDAMASSLTMCLLFQAIAVARAPDEHRFSG
jgi:hypothetical protein